MAIPLSGESELATAMIRPGTRAPSRGRNTRVSTPSGMMCTSSGRTRKSRQMSRLDDSDTVISGLVPGAPGCLATRRATRACIRTNPYQRRLDSARSRPADARSMRRSTLIGWWMLATSGSPSRRTPSSP